MPRGYSDIYLLCSTPPPTSKHAKETVTEVFDKTDKHSELKQTASEGKAETKSKSDKEAKAQKTDKEKEVKPEKAEKKSESKLDAKSEAKAEKTEKQEVKAEEAQEVKTEAKSKKKVKKEVSFDGSIPISAAVASATLASIPESNPTPAPVSHPKPIGPPPGFKIDAAKPSNAKAAAKLRESSDSGSNYSSEASESESTPTPNGFTRKKDNTSESAASVWNYGLNRSTDVPPPPGWNPPPPSADHWAAGPQTKSADMPDIEQFDPWAENAALGIVDLLLKDNSEEGASNGAAQGSAKSSQGHPVHAHHQSSSTPKFAVPSIPPPDYHHWQAPITTTRTQRSRFDFAREEDDPSNTPASTSSPTPTSAPNGLATSSGIPPTTTQNAALNSSTGGLNTSSSGISPTTTTTLLSSSTSGLNTSTGGLNLGMFPNLVDPGIVAAKPASKTILGMTQQFFSCHQSFVTSVI